MKVGVRALTSLLITGLFGPACGSAAMTSDPKTQVDDASTPPSADGTAATGISALPPVPALPHISLVNNQAADLVFGQADFVSTSSADNAHRLGGPLGRPALTNNGLYVSAWSANAAVVISPLPTASYPIIGYSWAGGAANSNATLRSLSHPEGISAFGSLLAVGDAGSNRVTLYNPLPIPGVYTQTYATVVFGQMAFTTQAAGCGPSGLNYPINPFLQGGRLFVPDSGNFRLLIWNSLPTATLGAPADLVLGQADMNSCASHACQNVSDPTALCGPVDVWTDGHRLLVSDNLPNLSPPQARLLIWNSLPTQNNQPADVVITGGTAADGTPIPFYGAAGLASNGTQLFMTTDLGNTILGWNNFPAQNVAPDLVLGQPTWTASPPAGSCTDHTFNRPNGVLVSEHQLFVTDFNNNRVLVFNSRD